MKIQWKWWVAAASLALPGMALAVGAIAVDDEEGDTSIGYGISTGASSREAASKEALAECRSANPKGSCKVMVWFESCGAYASNKTHYGVGWGKTEEAAKKKALSECGASSCRVKVSDCE